MHARVDFCMTTCVCGPVVACAFCLRIQRKPPTALRSSLESIYLTLRLYRCNPSVTFALMSHHGPFYRSTSSPGPLRTFQCGCLNWVQCNYHDVRRAQNKSTRDCDGSQRYRACPRIIIHLHQPFKTVGMKLLD